MTRALFRLKDGRLCGFTLEGHTGAGKAGEDIVCAAVSSAAYLAANTITEFCDPAADAEARDGYLRVTVRDAARCQDILRGFRLHMEQLQEQYPERIRVEILETV